MKKTIVENIYNWYRQTIRHPKYRWLIVLGTLLYLVGPVDISPDVFPIVGWIDDTVVATLLVTEVSQMLLESRKNNKNKQSDPQPNTIDVDAVSAN
ncbi:YkvA family protein [Aerosakkonemataceae cyanobacterium BLCC-F154]|uniref:YkvA family protein n=1 Tax=Floridaenema fluviatile BLCC-F154 TaxID=3153640 RepID=A0ABV4YH96_9CYAN